MQARLENAIAELASDKVAVTDEYLASALNPQSKSDFKDWNSHSADITVACLIYALAKEPHAPVRFYLENLLKEYLTWYDSFWPKPILSNPDTIPQVRTILRIAERYSLHPVIAKPKKWKLALPYVILGAVFFAFMAVLAKTK